MHTLTYIILKCGMYIHLHINAIDVVIVILGLIIGVTRSELDILGPFVVILECRTS